MEDHGNDDGYPEFFKIVFEPVSQGVRLPTLFMQEHGHNLHHNTVINLTVPAGDSWPVRLRRTDTGLWLGGVGWLRFAAHYDIEARHFLLFKYKNDQFRVVIMDPTASEVDYPPKGDEDDDHEVEEEVLGSGFGSPARDDYDSTIEVGEMIGRDLNPVRVDATIEQEEKAGLDSYRRAMSYESENRVVVCVMQPSYVTGRFIASLNTKSVVDFFPKEGLCIVKLRVPRNSISRVWSTSWSVCREGRKVTVGKGWKEFVVDNRLRVGDACVFELVDSRAMIFNVIIFRNT